MLFDDEKNDQNYGKMIHPIACPAQLPDDALVPANADATEKTLTEFPHQNFYRGQVTEDRLRHESEAHHGGLARWKVHTNNQRRYDDQVLHAGMGQPARPRTQTLVERIAYGHANDVPGMGLETENLQSFMSGGYHSVPLSESETPSQQEEQAEFQGESYGGLPAEAQIEPQTEQQIQPQFENQTEAATGLEPEQPQAPVLSVTRNDIPQMTIAALGDLATYRRKKSVTFTNLLARAQASLKT